jgi:NAD(P)-dependent dehydrogenase (short-subunit alcohol dehydrogenase family)
MEAVRLTKEQKFSYVVCDVTDYTSSCDALKKAADEVGQVPDCVFTIAGMKHVLKLVGSSVPGYMKDTDVKAYESQIKLNYLGTLYTVKEAARLMVEHKVFILIVNACRLKEERSCSVLLSLLLLDSWA